MRDAITYCCLEIGVEVKLYSVSCTAVGTAPEQPQNNDLRTENHGQQSLNIQCPTYLPYLPYPFLTSDHYINTNTTTAVNNLRTSGIAAKKFPVQRNSPTHWRTLIPQ